MSTKKTNTRPQPQKMVDFGTSISRFWKKYVDFTSTAQRSEYWFAQLFVVLSVLPLVFLTVIADMMGSYEFGIFSLVLINLFSAVILLPQYTLFARRCHDIGMSGKLAVIMLVMEIFSYGLDTVSLEMESEAIDVFSTMIMFVIGLTMLIIAVIPSKIKDNPYRK